jgi:uncharacterized protein
METSALIQTILQQYALASDGLHGVSHWARVWENGTRIAQATTGANLRVVRLFAFFHDAKRTNDGHDPQHGLRGADYAASLRTTLLQELSDAEFELLYAACAYHTDGLTDHHPTVQACWDADRLDLNRVGILPQPIRLCTEVAKTPELLAWANSRAANRITPEFIQTLWGLPA